MGPANAGGQIVEDPVRLCILGPGVMAIRRLARGVGEMSADELVTAGIRFQDLEAIYVPK